MPKDVHCKVPLSSAIGRTRDDITQGVGEELGNP